MKKKLEEIADVVKNEINFTDYTPFEGNLTTVFSTGCTLLDLDISGGRVNGGGIPSGIIIEVSGPSSSGKTALLSETVAIAQSRKGYAHIIDPEGRLDQEYSKIYGVDISKDNYSRPDTVNQFMDFIYTWKPPVESPFNIIGADSLAALSTELEMDGQDKMGMKRARDLSAGFRKICRLIKNNNWLIFCTNQVRQGQFGDVTPGGYAVGFYASLRIKLRQVEKEYAQVTNQYKKEFKEVIGIRTEYSISKSSVDAPYRTGDFFLQFGYGIDDIKTNLQYNKEYTKSTIYDCIDKEERSLNKAVHYIEEKNYQKKLKEKTTEYWYEKQKLLTEKIRRKDKERI